MIAYIIKSILCLLVLWGFYKLALEREAANNFKRFYLLASLIVAVTLPLITLTYTVEVTQEQLTQLPVAFQNFDQVTRIERAQPINWTPLVLGSIYTLGFLIFSIRFVRNLYRLHYKINHNEKVKEPSHINVLLTQKIVPHSFLKYIFLPKTDFKHNQIAPEILSHEQAHVTQKHSWDILFIEFLQVIFWFNPLLIFIKKSMALNHEFLADQAALKNQTDTYKYTNLLFQYSGGTNHTALSSPINYSLTKKRIVMLSQSFSTKKLVTRLALLLPILALCIYFFNQEIVAKPRITSSGLNATTFPDDSTVESEQENENPTTATSIRQKDLELGDSIMLVKHIPSANQLKEWQNDGQYGVWIDGKRIANEELQSHSSQDFDFYTQSKLEKNAVNYGKHYYQINLMTPEYFEEHRFLAPIKVNENHKNTKPFSINENGSTSKVKSVQKLKKLSVIVNGDEIKVNDKTTSINNFAKAVDKVTANWTDEDYELHALNIQFNNNATSLREKLNKEYLKTEIYKRTKMGLAPPPPPPPAPVSPISSELPPPPPPPAPIKGSKLSPEEFEILNIQLTNSSDIKVEGRKTTISEVKKFVGKNFKDWVESNSGKRRGIVFHLPKNVDESKAHEVFKELQNYKINSFTLNNESNLQPPAPPESPEALENVPPPAPAAPPAPPSPQEMLEQMTKDGATFYYNGDEITSKEAKKLFKEKENLNFMAKKAVKGKKPKVLITDN